MAHAHKPDFVFRRNGRVHLNRRGASVIRLLAAEVMLDTPCFEVVWRVLATHSIRQFPLHFPSCASPCAITFQLDSIYLSQINPVLNLKLYFFNPLNAKLNPVCHLLALLGAHHIFHVSGLRVKILSSSPLVLRGFFQVLYSLWIL